MYGLHVGINIYSSRFLDEAYIRVTEKAADFMQVSEGNQEVNYDPRQWQCMDYISAHE